MTRFQLRRLALQATRRPDLLPVLQDALLESPDYGETFEWAIDRAHASRDRNDGTVAVVVFSPVYSSGLFNIHQVDPTDLDWTRSNSWVRHLARGGRIPVYVRHIPERRRP